MAGWNGSVPSRQGARKPGGNRGGKRGNRKLGTKGRVAIAVGTVLLGAAIALGAHVHSMMQEANPAPGDGGVETVAASKHRFPKVNWDKWAEKNADIQGWVSIPGTKLSYPVAIASEEDPDFYLHASSSKKSSVYGTPFLDARSDGGLLDSTAAYLYGHHMTSGTMFTPVAKYTDRKWAKKHRTVLLQTREHKVALEFLGAKKVNAESYEAMFSFRSREGFDKWLGAELASCGRDAAAADGFGQIWALVTCSYGTWANQRTVAYFKVAEVDGGAPEAAEGVLKQWPEEQAGV